MNYSLDYFNTLCTISSALGTTSKYEDLLDQIVKGAVEAMNGKGAALFLADTNSDSEYFAAAAKTGLSKNYQHANPIHAKTIINTVLKEGGYLCVKDAASDPRIPNHEAKIAEGIASLLVVPVMVKDNTIGVLTLYTATSRDFSKKDIALLKALAEQGGLAIERSKLIKGILTYTRLFKNISENINSSLDIKNILNTLTCDICKSLEVKGTLIRLKDEDTHELKLVAHCNLSDEFLNKGPVYDDQSFAKVMEGESLIVEDVTKNSMIQYSDALVTEGIKSILSVPVKTKESVIGIMNLFSSEKLSFSKGMIEMAEALAIQGGIAIQNASIYLKLNETKDSLEKDIWGYRSWF